MIKVVNIMVIVIITVFSASVSSGKRRNYGPQTLIHSLRTPVKLQFLINTTERSRVSSPKQDIKPMRSPPKRKSPSG
jgi:hypothetical protein